MTKHDILSVWHCPIVDFSLLFSFLLQNHGEEISLRLRTDDLKGFRKYERIKKTLLHELVSNSAHQKNNFFSSVDPKVI